MKGMFKMKKILCVLLVLSTVIGMMSFSAYALSEGDWEYKIFENQAVITKYKGKDDCIVTPKNFRGIPVTEIDNYAFREANIKEIIISEGVTSIGIEAFNTSKPSSLEKVYLPSTLKIIKMMAFFDCKNLKEINFPQNISAIGASAFYGCNSLEIVDLSQASGIDLYRTAFSSCKSLKAVILPANPQLDSGVFSFCKSLTYINIPQNMTSIPASTFDGCTSLKFYIPKTVKTIYNLSINCGMRDIIIPYGVENLECMGGAEARTISIPSTVTKIGTNKANLSGILVYCAKNSEAEWFCRRNKISYLIDPSVDYKTQVIYDGTRIMFDTAPIIENGRTLVPLRAILEEIGASVLWDEENQIISAFKGDTTIKLQINSNKMYKNSEEIIIDAPAKLVNGRTLVPLRAIAESFNCNVNWIDYAGIIEISSNIYSATHTKSE